MKRITSILLLFFLVTITWAQGDVISVKDFAKIMNNDNVVLVSARKASDYKIVHIAGAVNIEHNTLYKNGPVKSVIKAPAELANIFGSKGVNQDKTIVLYDDGSGKYAGRLYWILKYLGAKDVRILDGHMKAWRAARKPVTKNPTQIKPATFTPNVNKNILASLAEVKKAMNSSNAVLVDVRSPEEFNGTNDSELKKGHIPGAINLEFKNVLNSRDMLKSKEELSALFTNAGITPDKEIILYCESSVRAGIVFLALQSRLGYPNVKVYDGAFLEWLSVPSNPVE